MLHLKAAPRLRLSAPLLGVVAGSVAAAAVGFYDFERVLRASWVGLPQGAWPGLDLGFGPAFAGLLPAFLFVALIRTIQTITAAVAVQRVSWRPPRAVDYRVVEDAVAADGVGKLVCGVGGIMPTQMTTVAAPTIEITGVAARGVGIAAGALMILLAFLSKALAAVLADPGPVYAAYLAVLLALIFVRGMSEVIQGGIDHGKALIAGMGFWVGVGCQNGWLFPEYLADIAGGLLANGITVGGLVAILTTRSVEVVLPYSRLRFANPVRPGGGSALAATAYCRPSPAPWVPPRNSMRPPERASSSRKQHPGDGVRPVLGRRPVAQHLDLPQRDGGNGGDVGSL